MKLTVAFASIVCLLAHPAVAGSHKREKAAKLAVDTLEADFDLAAVDANGLRPADQSDVAINDPEVPRGMDARRSAWTSPRYEMALLKDGPVLAMGAMGSRKKGLPKLAHVVLDWDF